MGFFSDLFFGSSSSLSSNSNQNKKKNDNFYAGPFDNDYDNYYGALHDEAIEVLYCSISMCVVYIVETKFSGKGLSFPVRSMHSRSLCFQPLFLRVRLPAESYLL